MVKVTLLNNGGFVGMESVWFPIEIDALAVDDDYATISSKALIMTGADPFYFDGSDVFKFPSTSFTTCKKGGKKQTTYHPLVTQELRNEMESRYPSGVPFHEKLTRLISNYDNAKKGAENCRKSYEQAKLIKSQADVKSALRAKSRADADAKKLTKDIVILNQKWKERMTSVVCLSVFAFFAAVVAL